MNYSITTNKFGSMPNQAYGELNGDPFYFRARHGGWCLRIAEKGDDPGANGVVVANGENERAGWWEEDEARKFLEEVLNVLSLFPAKNGRIIAELLAKNNGTMEERLNSLLDGMKRDVIQLSAGKTAEGVEPSVGALGRAKLIVLLLEWIKG